MPKDKINLTGDMRINYYKSLTRYTLAAQKAGTKIKNLYEIIALMQEESEMHQTKIKELEEQIKELQK
jgi:peptidoglycan hydrolase CwlO-like protein